MWIFKIKCCYHPRILDEHWCIYSCLHIPPRENWFQYVRRVYATAINCPCISTSVLSNPSSNKGNFDSQRYPLNNVEDISVFWAQKMILRCFCRKIRKFLLDKLQKKLTNFSKSNLLLVIIRRKKSKLLL